MLIPPPRSEYGKILDRVIQNLEADVTLQSYFGWEEVGPGETDWVSRRRIYKDDNGTATEATSPKLCATQICESSSITTLGDGGYADSDLIGTIGFIVSVNVQNEVYGDGSPDTRGEDEKQLASDLIHAVVDRVRAKCDDPDNLWSDVRTDYPISYDSTKGIRRASCFLDFYAQKDLTRRYLL